MKQYHVLIREILAHGERSPDRTGTGTLRVFGRSMRFDLADGLPLLTTKRVAVRQTIDELLWFLSGSTHLGDLPERTRHWWAPWAAEDGKLGPIYGEQYRRSSWHGGTVDQLALLIDGLRTDPFSRRHMINLWHTPAMLAARLPCCHGSVIQFWVSSDRRLSCQMYQRSADVFIGLPVNIASYAILTHLIAHVADLLVGDLSIVLGDAHLYLNHVSQAVEMLTREERPLPTLDLDDAPRDIDAIRAPHIRVVGYDPHPAINAPVAV